MKHRRIALAGGTGNLGQRIAKALLAGVPRFIPSDYAADFTRLRPGENRNFDLRREFHERLSRAPVQATSILNGAFADMLTGQAPLVLFKWRRILYWDNADQRLDFTTMDDVARFTASAALDSSAPRFLRVCGDEVTARELARVMTELTGQEFALWRAGGLKRLRRLIRFFRATSLRRSSVYPAWQGMQYFDNMFSGRAKVGPVDNNRYRVHSWTSAREVLAGAVGQTRQTTKAAKRT